MIRSAVFLFSLIAVTSSCLASDVVLDEAGEFTTETSSDVVKLPFTVDDATMALLVDTKATLTAGKVNVRVVAPDDETISDLGTSGWMTIKGQTIRTYGQTGEFHVQVVPQEALGTWSVRVALTPDTFPSLSVVNVVPGVGMTLVGLVAVLWWRWRSGAQWRWFWAGAAVWTVGVALKFAWAIPLNEPILGLIERLVPHDAYPIVGGIYIGLLTGVFEIGITLLAALIWKKMACDATRGVAVGVGAGAFEAILLGITSALFMIVALAVGGKFADQALQGLKQAAGTTSLIWLVGPVERVIAILCHVSSRSLVLLGVARGRWWWPFIWGFTIMTAIDSVAGYAYLAGLLGKISTWWVELAIAPFALVSVPIIVWCIRSWPSEVTAVPSESSQV